MPSTEVSFKIVHSKHDHVQRLCAMGAIDAVQAIDSVGHDVRLFLFEPFDSRFLIELNSCWVSADIPEGSILMKAGKMHIMLSAD